VLGTGIVDYEVTGALPNAAMWVFFGPSVLYDPSEPPIPLGTAPPLFWGLHLGTQKFIPFLIPTDANGTGRFSFFNTGVLNGILALQSPIADPSANLLGSATGSTL
jgi:hypothetical protein